MLTSTRRYRCAHTLLASAAMLLLSCSETRAQCSGDLIDVLRPEYIDRGDRFGWSLAARGSWAAVGAIGEIPSGSVTMYSMAAAGGGLTLTEQQQLEPPDIDVSDSFGASVAMTGRTLVAGATSHSGAGANAGAAYIYQRSGNAWTFEALLIPDDLQPGDAFGSTVAIRGDRVAIAALSQANSRGSLDFNGAVYVYDRVDGSWQLYDKITDPGAATPLHFGASIAFHGESLLIGAVNGGGSIVVFDDNGSAYEFEQRLERPTSTTQDFGERVAVAGDWMFAGVPREDTDGMDSGIVYVYRANVFGQWSPAGVLRPNVPRPELNFGWSVSAHDRNLVVGAEDQIDAQHSPGAAFLFTLVDGQWVQRDRLSPTDLDSNAEFGKTSLCYGELLLIGAPNTAELLPGWGDVAAYRASHACSCAADLASDDSSVGVADLFELLAGWGGDGAGAGLALPYDVVDVFDLFALLGSWGSCP